MNGVSRANICNKISNTGIPDPTNVKYVVSCVGTSRNGKEQHF